MTLRNPIDSIWADALQLLDQAERLQRRYCRLRITSRRGPCWEPPADIFETEKELTIAIALPGVAPEQVEIVIDCGVLLVVGERPMPSHRMVAVRRLEIPYGRFERRIDLPPGHYEIGERELENGCLFLNLRKLDLERVA